MVKSHKIKKKNQHQCLLHDSRFNQCLPRWVVYSTEATKRDYVFVIFAIISYYINSLLKFHFKLHVGNYFLFILLLKFLKASCNNKKQYNSELQVGWLLLLLTECHIGERFITQFQTSSKLHYSPQEDKISYLLPYFDYIPFFLFGGGSVFCRCCCCC